MICKKCGFEFVEGLKECPNCQTPNEPAEVKVLLPDERDTFEGVTIEETTSEKSEEYRVYNNDKAESSQRGTHVYHSSVTFGGLGFLWQILILLVVAGIIFVLLPTFLLIFMVMAAFYFILRLFR